MRLYSFTSIKKPSSCYPTSKGTKRFRQVQLETGRKRNNKHAVVRLTHLKLALSDQGYRIYAVETGIFEIMTGGAVMTCQKVELLVE